MTPFPNLQHPYPEPDYSRFAAPPEPNPQGGRPTLLTPDIVAEVCRSIRIYGMSDSKAGLLAGISTSTLSRWKAENEDFATMLGQARAQFEVSRLRNIGDAKNRDGSINWRAQAWLLQHSSPETYGPPSRRRLASADKEQRTEAERSAAAGNSPVDESRVMTPERLARLQALRRHAIAKMPGPDDEKGDNSSRNPHRE